MSRLEKIKKEIEHLYKTNPTIHMDISLSNPRINLKNAEATIIGIYPHIFKIEEKTGGASQTHTLQYADIFTNNISISELNQ